MDTRFKSVIAVLAAVVVVATVACAGDPLSLPQTSKPPLKLASQLPWSALL